jgi:indole-3-glycerol phosphate synthase
MSVLERIFAVKREEVAAAQARRPLEEVRAAARDASPPRGFRRALESATTDLALIAEVKRGSPSQGVIRPDFDPVEVARAYQRAGAHALSVLTDAEFFGGSPENLGHARSATQLPALRKDFLYDPYQVWEARAWGADAVLLIVAMLTPSQLAELQGLAQELGMDALVETHTEEEALVALEAGAGLIGVNNRNLADFRTDLSTSERILPMLAGKAVGVSESALESRADLHRVRSAGARAVLIGTRFCREPDIEAAVREVMGW